MYIMYITAYVYYSLCELCISLNYTPSNGVHVLVQVDSLCTSNTVYSLTHLMTLVSIYTPEIFDLIPGYDFRVVCRGVKSPHLLTNPLIIVYPPIFRIFLTPQLHDISSFL